MSTIKLKRSAVAGRVPTTAQLELGEVAINTADGKLYFKKYDPVANTESIVDVSADLDAAAILSLLSGVDGANSGLDADLLDGQQGSYYLDWANFTNTATGVVANTYGSSTAIPIITVDSDGRITSANTTPVAGVDDFTWDSANNQLTLTTGDGTIYNIYLNEFKDLTVEDLTANSININTLGFDALDVAGDISANNGFFAGDITVDGVVKSNLTVTLTGDVTGTTTSNTGTISVATDIAASGVTANTYGSATAIPVVTVAADGRITNATTTPVAGVDNFTYSAANNTITLETGDGSVFHVSTETEVTLTGDVTGTATATDGNLSITADIANTGVTAGTYGSASQIPVVTVAADGRITAMSNTAVAGVDDVVWNSSNSTLTIATGDGTTYQTLMDTFESEFNVNTTSGTGSPTIYLRQGGTVKGSLSFINGNGVRVYDNSTTSFLEFTTPTQAATDPQRDGLRYSYDVTGTGTVEKKIFHEGFMGNGSGLDADTLDGYSAQEIFDQSANNASNLIGDGQIDIVANNGLVAASTTFTLNQANNASIHIQHEDTSTQASVTNVQGSVIQSIGVDGFGHVTSLGTLNLDDRYYTETELDAGQLDNRYYTETEVDSNFVPQTTHVLAGTGLTGGGALSANVTISHTDTSSQANVAFANTGASQEFVEALDFDDFGHVISVTKGVRTYLDQATADARYVNVTGDTMTGNLTVQGNLNLSHSTLVSSSTTTTSTAQTTVQVFPTTYSGAELTITATQGSARHISKLLITHDGSTAIATEYGTVYTGSSLATFDVSISGPFVQLLATPASSSSTVFKVVGTTIT
jgi:hypothetical protein